MSKDPMGDRMKYWERFETERKHDPFRPICARLDGRSFSNFTRGLARPYDERFSQLMIDTTKHLVRSELPVIGYTQSDEITLLFKQHEPAQPPFGGKFHKLVSVLASAAAGYFNSQLAERIPEKAGKIASFDCRVFQLYDEKEAANALLWRWFDARKNSISMLAQAHFSHNQLQHKDVYMMQEMLAEKGIFWDEQPDFFQYGTFVRNVRVEEALSDEELAAIPEKHRPMPGTTRMRTRARVIKNMPPFAQVTNRGHFIFRGDDPRTDAYFHSPDDVRRAIKGYDQVLSCAHRVSELLLGSEHTVIDVGISNNQDEIMVRGMTSSHRQFSFPSELLGLNDQGILSRKNELTLSE